MWLDVGKLKIQEEFEDKITELELLEGNYEDNVMEHHQNLGGYIHKKKQNLLDSCKVFFDIHDHAVFPCRFLRINHLRQYEEELPIYAKKQEFLTALMANDVIIFKSNAGSGKSTQLPQYLLEVCKKRILVTEPRALAASSLAERVNKVGFLSQRNSQMQGLPTV